MAKHSNVTVNSKFLKECGISQQNKKIPSFIYIIFGGVGDLSKRKLYPALFHLYLKKGFPENFSIIGLARRDMDDNNYRTSVREALMEFCKIKSDKKKLDDFLNHIYFHFIELDNIEDYKKLKTRILKSSNEEKNNIVYYMAIPPSISPTVIDNISAGGLVDFDTQPKIVMEKPFGEDKNSAKKLNLQLAKYFNENSIYRMDHYLGKETVQNIIFFRFANSLFEPLWNSKYIENVQITSSETIGIGHRGNFYEKTGVIRDIIQNHMMQLIALIAMEPPVGFEADSIRDEKMKIFKAIRTPSKESMDLFVQGQYDQGSIENKDVAAYRQENNVAEKSFTPTFIGGTYFIDNWRWAGVPFYFRAGKRLKKHTTEIVIQFKHPPLKMFGTDCETMEPNFLVFTIQPEEEINLQIGIKIPGENNSLVPTNMTMNYSDSFGVTPGPSYERQILDSITGDLTLFARQDSIEAMWDAVDPLIKYWNDNPPKDFPNYSAGSWGPIEAMRLLTKNGHSWYTR